MQMTKEITTQILKSEQVGRKLLLEGQLQMASLFTKVLKPKDPTWPIVLLQVVACDIMFFFESNDHINVKQCPLYDDEMNYYSNPC